MFLVPTVAAEITSSPLHIHATSSGLVNRIQFHRLRGWCRGARRYRTLDSRYNLASGPSSSGSAEHATSQERFIAPEWRGAVSQANAAQLASTAEYPARHRTYTAANEAVDAIFCHGENGPWVGCRIDAGVPGLSPIIADLSIPHRLGLPTEVHGVYANLVQWWQSEVTNFPAAFEKPDWTSEVQMYQGLNHRLIPSGRLWGGVAEWKTWR